jgi:hypothetical protein
MSTAELTGVGRENSRNVALSVSKVPKGEYPYSIGGQMDSYRLEDMTHEGGFANVYVRVESGNIYHIRQTLSFVLEVTSGADFKTVELTREEAKRTVVTVGKPFTLDAEHMTSDTVATEIVGLYAGNIKLDPERKQPISDILYKYGLLENRKLKELAHLRRLAEIEHKRKVASGEITFDKNAINSPEFRRIPPSVYHTDNVASTATLEKAFRIGRKKLRRRSAEQLESMKELQGIALIFISKEEAAVIVLNRHIEKGRRAVELTEQLGGMRALNKPFYDMTPQEKEAVNLWQDVEGAEETFADMGINLGELRKLYEPVKTQSKPIPKPRK